jgi:PAP2 superfamily
MTPFALASPSQFLPAGPPSLASARYARDFNEVKGIGSANSTIRTTEQTQTAVFWQPDSPAAIWNRVADELAQRHDGSALRNARILALMNIALADATIAIWNAKNTFDTWRPITAIEQAATDWNPHTTPDASWTPLLVTPAFQEYPAGHPGVSNAAVSVLARIYGNQTAFTATSFGLPGVERSFTSFSSAVAQVENARVWAGIHFRFACVTGARMGAAVAAHVTRTQLLRIDPEDEGQTPAPESPMAFDSRSSRVGSRGLRWQWIYGHEHPRARHLQPQIPPRRNLHCPGDNRCELHDGPNPRGGSSARQRGVCRRCSGGAGGLGPAL